ncbi:MAG: YicC family protein [Lachnospiraceae bacterium]|nr:YicC family protein [Lachnospiraceae bacterium]
MIKSMTGFGRCEISDENRKFTVEMKAVNHRYLDVNMKMPKKLGFFESSIRNLLKNYIQRGKVDVFITYEDYTENNLCVKYNSDLAKEYMKYLNQIAEEFGMENDARVSSISRYPEVLTMEEQTVDESEIWKLLEQAICGACEQFVQARITEGENLRTDILVKLNNMLRHVDVIAERSPEIVAAYRKKLEEKVQEMLGDTKFDESRIVTEVTIFADKICVDEEIVRLKSHIESMKACLIEGGGIGRKLDFIAQEMNREANTTLSKANDLILSNIAIELKTEIEKVREQIQNIE